MTGANDPYGVDCPCHFCDQELDTGDERILGAHHSCVEADQAEVDQLWESARQSVAWLVRHENRIVVAGVVVCAIVGLIVAP